MKEQHVFIEAVKEDIQKLIEKATMKGPLQLWSFISYNWFFQWDYTCYKWGFLSTYNW